MADFVDRICAVCRLSDGLIISIIIADSSYPAPEECELVEVMAGQECQLGWHWDGQSFIPTADEII